MSLSHNLRPGPSLSLILLIALSLDNNFNFLPYIFQCLIISWVSGIVCKIIKTEVNSVYARKWSCLFCYAVSVGGWANLVCSWTLFGFCYCYYYLQDTMMVNFLCHLDWLTRCLDIWWDIITGCFCEGVSGTH